MLKLSIIVPAYNVEKYIAACLDSLIYPELPDYEVIIVNDGSTDGSLAIAERYAAMLPRLVRVISTENGGLGHARNTGLEASEGEYLLFVDSDDRLAENAVPEMLALLDGEVDILIFDFITVNEHGRELKYNVGSTVEGPQFLADCPQLLLNPVSACNKIWHKWLFLEMNIRFPDRIWFEDLATTPKLYIYAECIKHVPQPWYLYLQRTGSITNSTNLERNAEIITAMDITLDYYRERGRFEMYYSELEFLTLYNQLLTATTRINLIDRKSEIQYLLRDDFFGKFPGFDSNYYKRRMGFKLKFLLWLIMDERYLAVNLIMRLNKFIKGK